MCNGVVATSGGVVLAAIAKPSVWGSINVPRVLDNLATSLRRIDDIPGEDFHGGKLGDVVNDAKNVLAIVCVDICKEPILRNVSLDAPRQDEASISLLEVDKARLWVANGAAGLLQGEDFVTGGFGGSCFGINRKTKGLNCALESRDSIGVVALLNWVFLRQLSSEEVVTKGKDLAIWSDLYSKLLVFPPLLDSPEYKYLRLL